MMLKKIWTVALCLMTGVAHANLVTNGSFESTASFVSNAQNSMSLIPGSTALSGWSVINSANKDLAWIGPSNPFGITAADGGYSLDLSGYHDAAGPVSGVSQTLATVAGHTYSLEFFLGGFGSGGASIMASAGSASQSFSSSLRIAPGNAWDHYSMTFNANSSSTLISFLGISAEHGNYLGLDNVSVVDVTQAAPVPEPETYAMLLAGLGLLGVAARRRRRQATA